MSTSGPEPLTVALAVLGVLGVGYLLYRVLVQGRQLYGVERKREDGWAANRQQAFDLARARGWGANINPEGRAWPEDLDGTRDTRSCLLEVTGPDFDATTWEARERLPGAAVGVQSRLWLLRLSDPLVRHSVAVSRSSAPGHMALLPTTFHPTVRTHAPHGGLFAAGDPDGLTLLEPLLDQIVASGSWVITTPGTVTVLATLDPDASGFEWRLGLAHRVARALATP